MVETSLILNALILALIFAQMLRAHMKSEEVHERLDDVIDGVGLFATEVIKRTDTLLETASRFGGNIELHNHNPLEQIFRFIQGMKTGNFETNYQDNLTNPRDSHGQYASAQEENSQTPEIIDITD
tara:strand:+ start:2562 stop:2939 length:378 start_codon:yes stop_codon:yes gene_type:complete